MDLNNSYPTLDFLLPGNNPRKFWHCPAPPSPIILGSIKPNLASVFLYALIASANPLAASDPAPAPASTESLEAELAELKAKNEAEARRIDELQKKLAAQKKSESSLAAEDQQTRAFIEAYREKVNREAEDPDYLAKLDSAPDSSGFTFVAVRPAAPGTTASPGPAQTANALPQAPAPPPAPKLSPQEQHLAELRQELLAELSAIFDKIKENRRLRYGNNDPYGGGTFVENNTYDPETGQNKRGGKKPKLDVDLEQGINREYPENSSCFRSLSLSASLSRARVLRAEILELKSQLPN